MAGSKKVKRKHSGILDAEELRALWDKVEYLSDSIKEGYVNVHDLQKTIQEEYGVIF